MCHVAAGVGVEVEISSGSEGSGKGGKGVGRVFSAVALDLPMQLLEALLEIGRSKAGVVYAGRIGAKPKAVVQSGSEPLPSLTDSTDRYSLTIRGEAHQVEVRLQPGLEDLSSMQPWSTDLGGVLAGLEHRRSASLEMGERLGLAVALIDAGGKIVASNPGAQAMFHADDGLTNTCHMASQALLSAIRESVKQPEQKCARLVSRRSGARPYVVTVSPIVGKPSLVEADSLFEVLIDDPSERRQPCLEFFRSAYQLSSAEGRVAELMLSGLSIEETAQHLSLSRETVRSHLKRTLSKTGCRRQSELMLLLVRGPGGRVWG